MMETHVTIVGQERHKILQSCLLSWLGVDVPSDQLDAMLQFLAQQDGVHAEEKASALRKMERPGITYSLELHGRESSLAIHSRVLKFFCIPHPTNDSVGLIIEMLPGAVDEKEQLVQYIKALAPCVGNGNDVTFDLAHAAMQLARLST
jgi:hypothetical protein